MEKGNSLIDDHGDIQILDIGVYVALRDIHQASGNIHIPSTWMYMPVDVTHTSPISRKTDVFGFTSTVYEVWVVSFRCVNANQLDTRFFADLHFSPLLLPANRVLFLPATPPSGSIRIITRDLRRSVMQCGVF